MIPMTVASKWTKVAAGVEYICLYMGLYRIIERKRKYMYNAIILHIVRGLYRTVQTLVEFQM